MNLQENIQRITEVMGIIKEVSMVQTEELEIMLNRFMKKDFEWWKKIELDSYSITDPSFSSYIGLKLYGTLYVDEDWGRKSWEELHYKKLPSLHNDLGFGNLVDYDAYMIISKKIKHYYLMLSGENVTRVNLNDLDIKLI